MTSDPLSLLRAGLDEDERIARAACDAARADTEGDASRWFVDEEEGRESAGVTSGFPQRVVGRPGGANGVVVYDEGYPHVEQARHIARQDPKATLDRVEAIRAKVIAPYLAAVDAVKATVSARQYAASRHALAAIRLDHGGGDAMEERRTREELLSAEVQLASDVAKRDACASVIAALASIYAPEPTETGEPQ